MGLIRRSVAFPKDVYEALRTEAFSRRVSVNRLVVERVMNVGINKVKDKKKIEDKIERDLVFFKKIGDRIKKDLGKVDASKIIREERDRDNV